MSVYKVNSPVLFLVFNRPDTTLQVFNAIRLVQPSKLYIAADGARTDSPSDKDLCKQVKHIIGQVDWPCEVRELYREENLGCKVAVSGAIDWFFQHEQEGIILEDDCLPSSDFFSFCDQMLDHYRLDTRIRHITGTCLRTDRNFGDESYYFAQMTNIWGWATWRRVWADYDKDLKQYEESEAGYQLSKVFRDSFLKDQWMQIFKDLKSNKIDTWDFQLAFLNYFNNGLSVSPNSNLITNIGFRSDATHTSNPDAPFANLPLQEMRKITHPKYFLPEYEADYAIFQKEFHLEERRKKHYSLRRRFKRWLRTQFK